MCLTCFSMSCITESASFFHPKSPSDPAPRLCVILSSISISSLFFTSMVSMSVCGIAGTRPYKNFSNIAYLKCKLWQSNNSQGIYNLVCYQVVNDGFNNICIYTYDMEIRILNRYTISFLNVIQSWVLRCMLIYFQNININMCGKWRLLNRIWVCFVMYDLYAFIVTTTCIKTYF